MCFRLLISIVFGIFIALTKRRLERYVTALRSWHPELYYERHSACLPQGRLSHPPSIERSKIVTAAAMNAATRAVGWPILGIGCGQPQLGRRGRNASPLEPALIQRTVVI
jgi:hypothetical protein